MNRDRYERPKRLALLAAAALLLPVCAPAQETLEQRLQRVERENREILSRLDELSGQNDALAEELERFEFQDIIPRVGESQHGLGPAASKVYQKDQGLSIGGYGEFLLRYR